MKKNIKQIILAGIFFLLSSAPVYSVSIIGGSDLLDMTTAGQLETWLGEGEITLENIFTKVDGDGQDASDFHAAADGQGRTFTIISITSTNYTTPIIFGGYNPQSWSTINNYNYTYADELRTAFLFNITDPNNMIKWDQKKSSDNNGYAGQYQTYNTNYYGPTFGGGHDEVLNNIGGELNFKYNYAYSYGPNLGGSLPGITGLTYNESSRETWNTDIEIFTIANSTPVPEPVTILLLGSGLAGLAGFRRKLRKN